MGFTQAEWDAAVTWEKYYGSVRKHADLWRHHWEQAEVDGTTAARLRDLPGDRRVLILTEDWCGDAVRSVPVIAKALLDAPRVEVRLIDIAGHPDLIARHLSKGAKAIPVAIVADGEGRELGWWGPRPAPLQALLRARLAEHGPPSKEEVGSFYAPVMAWYRKDGGRTVLEEVALLLERGGEPR